MTRLLQTLQWMPFFWLLPFAERGVIPADTNRTRTAAYSAMESNGYPSVLLPVNDSDVDILNEPHDWLTDPLFNEYWFNDQLFVYDDYTYEQLPDEINIDLMAGSGPFTLNWYGMMNSPFGERWGRPHRGIDLHLRTGDTVVSSFDGVIRYARYNKGGYGNCIVIRHANGLETLYGHLSKINVKENQFVESGEMIGRGGSSGKSDGPHLHFETRYKDFAFDPLRFFDTETQQLTARYLHIPKKELSKLRYAEEELKAIRESRKKRKSSSYRNVVSRNRSSSRKYHTVKKGESVHTIAKKYGIPRTRISELNGVGKHDKLRPGKKLRIK